MTLDIVKELNGIWSVLVGIGALIAFGSWIRTSLMSLEKRVGLIEKQLDTIVERDHKLREDIAAQLAHITTMLETRPCVLGRDTRSGEGCE